LLLPSLSSPALSDREMVFGGEVMSAGGIGVRAGVSDGQSSGSQMHLLGPQMYTCRLLVMPSDLVEEATGVVARRYQSAASGKHIKGTDWLAIRQL
jgi:hypothetical protein